MTILVQNDFSCFTSLILRVDCLISLDGNRTCIKINLCANSSLGFERKFMTQQFMAFARKKCIKHCLVTNLHLLFNLIANVNLNLASRRTRVACLRKVEMWGYVLSYMLKRCNSSCIAIHQNN
jgi:hypothetical protein